VALLVQFRRLLRRVERPMRPALSHLGSGGNENAFVVK
jgi:hypothetical protein